MADGAASSPTLTSEAHRAFVDAWLRDRRPLAEAAATVGISAEDAEAALRGFILTQRLRRQEHEREARRLRAMLDALGRLDPLKGGGIVAAVEHYEQDTGTTDEEGLPLAFAGITVTCATSDERWLAGAVDDALERLADLIDPAMRGEHSVADMERAGVTADDPEEPEPPRPVYTGAPWRIEGEGSVLRLGDFDEKTGRGKVLFEVSASLETMQSAPFGRMVMAVEGRAMPEPVAQKSGPGADPRQTALPWGPR